MRKTILLEDLIKIKSPYYVELALSGLCQCNCPYCWGPLHNNFQPNLEQWKSICFRLASNGMKAIGITGGEPLMIDGIEEFVKYLKKILKLHITLSTNGILFKKKCIKVINYIDEIGIPIDNYMKEKNDLIKGHGQFDKALDAMRNIQIYFPKVDLTCRLVVSRLNSNDFHLIGKALIKHGIDPQKIRIKLYEVTALGPRALYIRKNLFLTHVEFDTLADQFIESNPHFVNITVQKAKDSIHRYFVIMPDGSINVVISDKYGEAIQKYLGNIFSY